MPTGQRREKDELRKQAKLAEQQLWDKVMAEMPAHIQGQLGLDSSLSNNLHTDAPHLRRVGILFDEHTGQPYEQELPPELGANVESRERREDLARHLRGKHPTWSKRGYAKRIAHAEGLSVRRVQKLMKDFP